MWDAELQGVGTIPSLLHSSIFKNFISGYLKGYKTKEM